jgi:hypothetical protein
VDLVAGGFPVYVVFCFLVSPVMLGNSKHVWDGLRSVRVSNDFLIVYFEMDGRDMLLQYFVTVGLLQPFMNRN